MESNDRKQVRNHSIAAAQDKLEENLRMQSNAHAQIGCVFTQFIHKVFTKELVELHQAIVCEFRHANCMVTLRLWKASCSNVAVSNCLSQVDRG